MRIKELVIKNLRAISDLRVEPGADVNFIIGANGAGKTTFLEGIFLLSRGRSFRGSRYGPLCKIGSNSARIAGRVETNGVRHGLQLDLFGTKKRLQEDGRRIRRVRDLSNWIQVRMVTENPQKFLEDQPEARRLFMDWNLFHVEHGYAEKLADFNRVSLQRNAWLKSGAKGRPVWDDQFIDLAKYVTETRRKFAEWLSAEFLRLQTDYPDLPSIEVSFYRGWKHGAEIGDIMARSLHVDAQRGYTSCGPARADLRLKINGLTGLPSRGQTKIAVFCLQFAAQRIFDTRKIAPCIWLLDDIRSELDVVSYCQVMEVLINMPYQIFMTSLQDSTDVHKAMKNWRCKMFHVERGVLLAS